ncbi:S8 family serine peptidase [Lentzea sp. NPDC051838]|uniref:S8 family peptidase n=1 Tax=Lentzea sp. NPDC051838 TaxID=3154849 RepID=UPI00343CD906
MRSARCLAAAVLAAGLVSPVAAQAAPVVTGHESRTITLITGDKVVVDERGSLLRVDGRPGMSFAKYVQNDHQYVVPADAVDAVGQDRVDKRFFDVTALHQFGYTDDRVDSIPVLDNNFRAAGAVAKKDARQQWNPARGAGKLWLNGRSKLLLDQSVPMVGAPAAWEAGFDGTGVTVAVLDTGYDQNHPELAGVVSASKDFTPSGIQDDVGHGTHVAATVAGHGGKYTGVAKGAKLAIGRVCEFEGCYDSAVVAGMEWAAREVKARVVNMSLGSDQTDGTDPMSVKVNELTAETGALFVIAAGNSGTFRKVSSPASADAALAVANMTKTGVINDGSSRGPRIGDFAVKPDLGAPGTDIVAARAKGTLEEFAVDDLHARISGTSMASPHVAGAAAVLVQRNPSWTAAELKAHLMATVKPVADSPSNVGTGLLDVGRAVTQQVRASAGSLSFGLLEFPHTRTFTKTITYRNDGSAPVSLALTHDLGANFTVPGSVVVPAAGTASVDVVLDPRVGLGQFFGHVKASGGGASLTTSVGAYVQEERHKLSLKLTGRDGKPARNEFAILVNLSTRAAEVLSIGENGVGEVKLPVADYAVLARIEEFPASYSWFTPVSATEVAGRVSLAADVSVHVDARQAKPFSVTLPDSSAALWYRSSDISVPMNAGRINGIGSTMDGRVPLYSAQFGAALPELKYDQGLKGGQPIISVPGGFPVRYFDSSKFLAPGDHVLDVAERGSDVRGKLALVRSEGEDLLVLAEEMKAAGAVAVLYSGPVPLPYDEQTAIPVVTVAPQFAVPGKLTLRAVQGSPVSYTLSLQEKGKLPVGTHQVRRSDLAEVKARYHTSGADGFVRQRNYPVRDGAVDFDTVLDEPLWAPMERTEYYSAGTWFQEGFDGRGFGGGDDPTVTSWADLRPVTFAAGHRYERSQLRGVSSPRLGAPTVVQWSQGGGVSRSGDALTTRISPFGWSGAVENWVYSGSGTLELSHNGTSLGVQDAYSGAFNAPSRTGRYKLALNASRQTSALSTSVRTTWEFSASVDGRLALPEVDYTLPLDLRNSWKAGAPMPAKFTASGAVRELRAYASFDDGANWVPVKSIVPPGGKPGGYVSLRVVATDANGNSVDQTVVRAYRLKA